MEHVVPLVAVAHFEREYPDASIRSEQRHRDGASFAVSTVDDRYPARTEGHADGIVGIATDDRESGEDVLRLSVRNTRP